MVKITQKSTNNILYNPFSCLRRKKIILLHCKNLNYEKYFNKSDDSHFCFGGSGV